MDEALDPVAKLGDGVGHCLRAEDVRLEEEAVVVDRARDMGLGRHVHDDVGA